MRPNTLQLVGARSAAALSVLALGGWAIGSAEQTAPQPVAGRSAQTSGVGGDAGVSSVEPASLVMIDTGLKSTSVRVSTIELRPDGRGEVRVVEPDGRERRVAFSTIAALAPADFGSVNGSPDLARGRALTGWVELTDGQILTGELERADAASETLEWSSPRWHNAARNAQVDWPVEAGAPMPPDQAPLRLSIDRVRRIVQQPDASFGSMTNRTADGAEPVGDVAVLRNGDVLRGFVERIETDEAGRLRVMLETDGRVVSLPYESLAQLVLQSPAAAAVPAGPNRAIARVALADGTSVLVGQITPVSPGRVKMSVPTLRSASISEDAAEPASMVVDVSEIRSVVPTTTRLTPLSSLKVVRHEPTPDRRRAEPPGVGTMTPPVAAANLGAATIALDGPCVIEWELPSSAGAGEGAIHVAGRVSLAAGAAPWGACELRLELVGAESSTLTTVSLSAERSSAIIHASIPAAPPAPGSAAGRRLRLTVESGGYGPVRDAVTLEQWLLLQDRGRQP